MKPKIIIDNDISKYYPCFNLSQVIVNELNINKFDFCYVFIDDLNLFKKYHFVYDKNNVIFLYNKNVKFNIPDIDVEIINYDTENVDFKKKVIKQGFIYNFLFDTK